MNRAEVTGSHGGHPVRPIEYAITRMSNGLYRAECHVCDWWDDFVTFINAENTLHSHVVLHPGVKWARQREEVKDARPESPSTPGRTRTKERVCDYCGETFMANRSDAKFCSASHRAAFSKTR